MYCPRCKCEYVESFNQCPDCNTSLVERLPNELKENDDLVDVFETSSQMDIIYIESILEAEGITHHFSGAFFHMMGVMPSPARLLVPFSQRENVLNILKELLFI